MSKKILSAPCLFCGYNGSNYWQKGTHEQWCPWHNVGGDRGRKRELRHVVSGIFHERKQATSILSHAVDIDSTDLLSLCHRVENDLNSEHGRALQSEEKLEGGLRREDVDAICTIIQRRRPMGRAASLPWFLEKANSAAEKLVMILRLYDGHEVRSRGPLGLIIDALRLLVPDVARELEEGADAGEVHERCWPEDSDA